MNNKNEEKKHQNNNNTVHSLNSARGGTPSRGGRGGYGKGGNGGFGQGNGTHGNLSGLGVKRGKASARLW